MNSIFSISDEISDILPTDDEKTEEKSSEPLINSFSSLFPISKSLLRRQIQQTKYFKFKNVSDPVQVSENEVCNSHSRCNAETSELHAENMFLAKEKFNLTTCKLQNGVRMVPNSRNGLNYNTTRSTFLIVFSPDNKLVASAHGDHKIYISHVSNGHCLAILQGHPRTPWCITFSSASRKGCLLASGCLGGQVRIWDLSSVILNDYSQRGSSNVSPSIITCCEVWKSSGVIASISFHPTEDILAIATFNRVYFWNWVHAHPHIISSTSMEREKVRYVRFDTFGTSLITGVANLGGAFGHITPAERAGWAWGPGGLNMPEPLQRGPALVIYNPSYPNGHHNSQSRTSDVGSGDNTGSHDMPSRHNRSWLRHTRTEGVPTLLNPATVDRFNVNDSRPGIAQSLRDRELGSRTSLSDVNTFATNRSRVRANDGALPADSDFNELAETEALRVLGRPSLLSSLDLQNVSSASNGALLNSNRDPMLPIDVDPVPLEDDTFYPGTSSRPRRDFNSRVRRILNQSYQSRRSSDSLSNRTETDNDEFGPSSAQRPREGGYEGASTVSDSSRTVNPRSSDGEPTSSHPNLVSSVYYFSWANQNNGQTIVNENDASLASAPLDLSLDGEEPHIVSNNNINVMNAATQVTNAQNTEVEEERVENPPLPSSSSNSNSSVSRPGPSSSYISGVVENENEREETIEEMKSICRRISHLSRSRFHFRQRYPSIRRLLTNLQARIGSLRSSCRSVNSMWDRAKSRNRRLTRQTPFSSRTTGRSRPTSPVDSSATNTFRHNQSAVDRRATCSQLTNRGGIQKRRTEIRGATTSLLRSRIRRLMRQRDSTLLHRHQRIDSSYLQSIDEFVAANSETYNINENSTDMSLTNTVESSSTNEISDMRRLASRLNYVVRNERELHDRWTIRDNRPSTSLSCSIPIIPSIPSESGVERPREQTNNQSVNTQSRSSQGLLSRDIDTEGGEDNDGSLDETTSNILPSNTPMDYRDMFSNVFERRLRSLWTRAERIRANMSSLSSSSRELLSSVNEHEDHRQGGAVGLSSHIPPSNQRLPILLEHGDPPPTSREMTGSSNRDSSSFYRTYWRPVDPATLSSSRNRARSSFRHLFSGSELSANNTSSSPITTVDPTSSSSPSTPSAPFSTRAINLMMNMSRNSSSNNSSLHAPNHTFSRSSSNVQTSRVPSNTNGGGGSGISMGNLPPSSSSASPSSFMSSAAAAVSSLASTLSLTHRIQRWPLVSSQNNTLLFPPDLTDPTANVVVDQAKIHNDASVDINATSTILVTLIIKRKNTNSLLCGENSSPFIMSDVGVGRAGCVGVFSLGSNHPNTRLGDCLAIHDLESSAVSVSLSPTCRHLLVGLVTSRQRNLSSFLSGVRSNNNSSHGGGSRGDGKDTVIAQVYHLKLPQTKHVFKEEGRKQESLSSTNRTFENGDDHVSEDICNTDNIEIGVVEAEKEGGGSPCGQLVLKKNIPLCSVVSDSSSNSSSSSNGVFANSTFSLNCIRWVPAAGQGMAYATSTGLLKILK